MLKLLEFCKANRIDVTIDYDSPTDMVCINVYKGHWRMCIQEHLCVYRDYAGDIADIIIDKIKKGLEIV